MKTYNIKFKTSKSYKLYFENLYHLNKLEYQTFINVITNERAILNMINNNISWDEIASIFELYFINIDGIKEIITYSIFLNIYIYKINKQNVKDVALYYKESDILKCKYDINNIKCNKRKDKLNKKLIILNTELNNIYFDY